MSTETRRIKDLAVTTSPYENDMIPVDGIDGTRGITFKNLVARIFNKVGFNSISGDNAVYTGVMRASNFITGDGADVNALKANIDSKASQSSVDTLQAQINNAISSVSSDTELTDIRIKADGTTAATAGEAVRNQVEDLQTQINAIAVTVTDDDNGTVTLSIG